MRRIEWEALLSGSWIDRLTLCYSFIKEERGGAVWMKARRELLQSKHRGYEWWSMREEGKGFLQNADGQGPMHFELLPSLYRINTSGWEIVYCLTGRQSHSWGIRIIRKPYRIIQLSDLHVISVVSYTISFYTRTFLALSDDPLASRTVAQKSLSWNNFIEIL